MTPSSHTLTAAADDLRHRRTTAVELVEASLAAVARHQGPTNAFTHVHADAARAAAKDADAVRAANADDLGPLHGLPITIKDLIDVTGEVTSAGSRVLATRVAEADAIVVARLRRAGAILLGRTNLHEFALGTTSEDSAFGAVHNPLDAGRSAGGSSGGSAAAVATGMGLASIGTDTGGSIRIPAAACGIVGLKPGYGEVPTDGIIPLCPSFDHAGPLTRTVADASLLWSVIADRPQGATGPVDAGRLRLAVLGGVFASPIAPEVQSAFERAIDVLRRAGATVTTQTLAAAPLIPDMYVRVVLPEAAAWHAAYLDVRAADYSTVVRTRLLAGREISAVAYLAAQAFRQPLRQEVDAVLADADVIVLPTLPIVAPPLGLAEIEIDPAVKDRTPVRTAMLKHTQPFNLTGHPAISLPLPTAGLPVGLQLVGRRGGTPRLLAIAAACEKMWM
jgi:aspartyl-tRNA(Asn)/glutamyl-tRNA(Gln) amidotransferase subunit A